MIAQTGSKEAEVAETAGANTEDQLRATLKRLHITEKAIEHVVRELKTKDTVIL
jgi:hypothetical protein